VGWSIDASPTAALVTNALGMAIDSRLGKCPQPGLIIHSDQGVQGEFKWSSQHLDLEVLDGKKAAGCRSCAASEDAFAGQVGLPAAS
jgi:hypothetical protein